MFLEIRKSFLPFFESIIFFNLNEPKLVEISGGKIAGFIFIINLFDLGGNQKLKDKSYFTESLIDFPGH